MGNSTYLKFAITILTVAVIFLGVLIINGLDRVTASNLLLAEKIASMPRGGATVVANVTQKESSNIANLEFFDPNATAGGRIIQATIADTQNMNNLINNDATVSMFHSYASSSLATRNYETNEFQPLLADSWEISEDKKSYRIKLRKGVLWHDFTDPVTGKKWSNVELTAHDFKFYIDVIKNPDVNCAAIRGYYQDIESVEIVNDYEFVVNWSKIYYGSRTATLGMSPLPRHLYHAYEGDFDGKKFNSDFERNRVIVGCGPYRFLRWDKDLRVIFTKFENYFGKKYGIEPALDKVVFELIKHPNTRFQALLAGSVDRLSLTPEQWFNRTNIPEFKEGKIKKYSYLSQSYSYIGYNLANPLFQDKRVRQALTMLVDREKIIKDVMQGLAVIINGPFFPKSVYYNSTIAPLPYDIAKAKALLAEAGWSDSDGDGVLDKDGRKFSFSIMQVNGSTVQGKMLPIIKESFAKAGVELQIQPLEWSVCLQRIDQRKFDSAAMGWTMPLDPDPFQVWHSSQAEVAQGSNYIGYKNPEMDRLIEELRVTFDEDKRIEICHQMAEILHEDQPYTFLFTPFSLQAISGRYNNVKVFPGGIPDDIIWTPTQQQLSVTGL